LATLMVLANILKVALGIGLLIFFHELGHFLAAKWMGVKVLTFSIGFPPRMVRLFKWRETDVILSWLPLGGYVRMLGEEPPAEGQPKVEDPAAFHNKSVGARMIIMTAGVATNLVLGVLLFIAAYMLGGLEVIPLPVQGVVAGSPAYKAGVRPGDEVVAINGQGGVGFVDLTRAAGLSGDGEAVTLTLKRPGAEAPVTVAIRPRREARGDMPTVGILMPEGLALVDDRPYIRPAGATATAAEGAAPAIPKGSRVVAVGPVGSEPTPVESVLDLDRALARDRDRPIAIGLASGEGPKATTSTVELPPTRFVDFGFRLTPGPVVAIAPGGPAARSGFREGDLIEQFDGRPVDDPMRLPDLAAAAAGREVEVVVKRSEKLGADAVPVALKVTPDATPAWTERILADEPLDVPGLGLAVRVTPEIAAVAEGSPAAQARLLPEQTIRSITMKRYDFGDEPVEVTLAFDGDEAWGWPAAFWLLQQQPLQEVRLGFGDSKSVAIRPVPVDGWYFPLRGLVHDLPRRPLEPLGLAEATRRSLDETASNVGSIFRLIRGLVQGRLGTGNVAGPLRIPILAFSVASYAPPAAFLNFLGMLSINLAVINFLPIPPLDGGQMVLLIAERLRGRPLPESAQGAVQMAGILFFLLLFVLVMFQDIRLTFFG